MRKRDSLPGQPDPAFVTRLRDDLERRLAPVAGGPVVSGAPPRTRRRVIAAAAGLAAAAGAGGGYLAGTAPASTAPVGPAPRRQALLQPALGAWQVVATSGQVPDGTVLAFDAGPVFGYVGRSAGRLLAVSGVCTHQGCRLVLDSPARQLACPCHSATFTLAGAVIQHPRLGPLPPLPRLPVRESAGRIEILAPTTPPAPPG